MKHQKWLARVAVASLVFGMAGIASTQADEMGLDDGETVTIENRDVKGVNITNGSTLNAKNVNFIDGGSGNQEVAVDNGGTLVMTGGSIKVPDGKFSANGGKVELTNTVVTSGVYLNGGSYGKFENSDISGDILYVGHEWENDAPKEVGTASYAEIAGGNVSVKTLWMYDGEANPYTAIVKVDNVKMEKESLLSLGTDTFSADKIALSGHSRINTFKGSFTANTILLSGNSRLVFRDGAKANIGEIVLDGSRLTVGGFAEEHSFAPPEVTVQKMSVKNESKINVEDETNLQIGSILSDGTASTVKIEGPGTVTVNDVTWGAGTITLGAQSDDEEEETAVALTADVSGDDSTTATEGGVKLVTKKLTLQDATIAVSEGSSYELQGEENVLSGAAKISVTDGSSVSLADGAALHAEADENNNLKTVIEADADSTADVSKGTLYVSNAKKDGTAYDVSTAVKQGDEAKGNDFKSVYGASRRVAGTKNEAGEWIFASNISEIAKDSAIPNVLTAADSLSGAFTDFLDKAFGDGMTDAEGHNAVEHAASMAGMLGVAHGTYSFAEDMSALIADHAGKERGIWATYVHQDRSVDGFSAIGRKAKYDMKYNGILLGGDFRTKENARTGFAFMYADGSHTEKDGVSGKADTKYYGLDIYHHFQAGGVSYKADIGYIKGDYDLEQTQLGTTNKGDVGGNSFFAGIRAEKDFACGTGTVTPYAGLRYYRVHTGDFTDSLGLKHETGTANVWSLPLGVEFRHESKNGDWTVSPVVELGYRFILGGKDVNETVRFGTASDSYSVDVAENSFLARLGIEAESPVWSLGGGYRYQKGSDSRANEWYLQVGYRF